MRDELRRRIAESPSVRAKIASFAQLPASTSELSDILIDSKLELAQLGDPSTQGLLLVRLSGDSISDGFMDRELQEQIVQPLIREIEESTPKKIRDSARVGLVGVSTGSVVLHFRARVSSSQPGQNDLDFAMDNLEGPILRVNELHSMLEAQTPAVEISRVFGREQGLLKQARRLVRNLSDQGISLSSHYAGAAGSIIRSQLGTQGQKHALKVFESAVRDETVTVTGLVTALSIEGEVTVTRSPKRRTIVEVGAVRIRDARLSLGEHVSIRATKIQEFDHVGVALNEAKYEFIDFIEEPRDVLFDD